MKYFINIYKTHILIEDYDTELFQDLYDTHNVKTLNFLYGEGENVSYDSRVTIYYRDFSFISQFLLKLGIQKIYNIHAFDERILAKVYQLRNSI
jgi:hypothetical protein